MSHKPTRVDQDLSGEVKRQFSSMINTNSHSSRLSNALLLFLMQAISFSVKIFIREKIGRLSYSVATIIVAYFWVRYFMGGNEIDILRNGIPDVFNGLDMGGEEAMDSSSFSQSETQEAPQRGRYSFYLGYLLGLLEILFTQIGVLVFHGLEWEPPVMKYMIIYVYSYVVVLMGTFLLIKSRFAYLKREDQDPLDRGESLVFANLEGKRLGDLKINKTIILMWLDPLLVVLTGLVFWSFNGNFGILIMASGIVLFIEEWLVRSREQRAVLNKIASEKWTEKVLNEYKEFKEGKENGHTSTFGKVSFAEDENQDNSGELGQKGRKKQQKGLAGFA